jgi:hypothetical protein
MLARFSCFRWVAAAASGVALTVTLAAVVLPTSEVLVREGGMLEGLSVGLWVLACLAAFVLAVRSSHGNHRLLAAWMGVMAGLAALRELDLHVWLNPKHLGALGVRFRLDWWMSGEVNPWLKVGWMAFSLVIGFVVFYPPAKLRRLLWRRFLEGDTIVGLLVFAAAFLGFGYVIDDILRPVRFLSSGTKQLVEETSEMIGAILYCACTVLQWRRDGPEASQSDADPVGRDTSTF